MCMTLRYKYILQIRSLKSKVTTGTKCLEGKDAKLSELQMDLETEIAVKTDLETKFQEQEINMNTLMQKLETTEKRVWLKHDILYSQIT